MKQFWKAHKKLHIWFLLDVLAVGAFFLFRGRRSWMNAIDQYVTGPFRRWLGSLCYRVDSETLFFPAGASGLASVGIPMAKAFGAYVITSVQTADHKARIVPLGADVVVDTSSEDVVEVIQREAAQGHPIDLAIDCLAGEVIGQAFPYVNEGCRWVLISTLAGVETRVPLRAVLTKDIQLKGSMLRKRSVEEKAGILSALTQKVWPKLESGEMKVSIDRIFPIEQAADAHKVLERGENVGKVVLKVR